MCSKQGARQVAGRLVSQGFTLVELMIVVVIVTILAAVAYPSYQDSVIKTNRSLGKGALMELMNKQEQHFVNNKSYADAVTDLAVAGGYIDNQGIYSAADTGSSIYLLEVSDSTATTYTLTATPQGNQTKDTRCGTLSITNAGVKTVTGSDTAVNCWK